MCIGRLTHSDCVPLSESVRFEMWLLDSDKTLGEMEAVKVIAIKWTSTSNPAAALEIIVGRPIGTIILLESTFIQALVYMVQCYVSPHSGTFWWGITALVGVATRRCEILSLLRSFDCAYSETAMRIHQRRSLMLTCEMYYTSTPYH